MTQVAGLSWLMARCPAYGVLRRELTGFIARKPQPWRSHGTLCLVESRLTAGSTYVIAALNEKSELSACTWLSLPDVTILAGFDAWSYVYHVYVSPDSRREGLGRRVLEMALSISQGAAVKGVLLASAQVALREKFYASSGFKPLAPDPWLMVRNQGITHHRVVHRSDLVRPLVRSVSSHDIATIQSICAQRHWYCREEDVRKVSATECEEEFCSHFCHPRCFQFLVRASFGETIVLSWLSKRKAEWVQRILCHGRDATEIKQISWAIRRAIVDLTSPDVPRRALMAPSLSLPRRDKIIGRVGTGSRKQRS